MWETALKEYAYDQLYMQSAAIFRRLGFYENEIEIRINLALMDPFGEFMTTARRNWRAKNLCF